MTSPINMITTSVEKLCYKVIYRNGDRVPVEIAELCRTEEGRFVFEYYNEPKYEFPGFDRNRKRYENNTLWGSIAFRVPNVVRNQYPNVTPEELLEKTEGRLVTDHFEFLRF